MDKNINSYCICQKSLASKKKLESDSHYELVAIFPCEHIIHISCIDYSWIFCPYCPAKIIKYLQYKQIKNMVLWQNQKKYHQIYTDISAIYNLTRFGKINYWNIFTRTPEIIKLIYRFININNQSEGKLFVSKILDLLNIKLVVKNKNKIYPGKKIIISNHTSQFDPFFIYAYFHCGFLSSIILLEKFGISHILDIIPLILIKRGSKINTVNKIKKFMEKNTSICIFPEGLITHPKTIAKFRTGAFYTGYPVQPVIIKYKPNIFDLNYLSAISKIISQDKLIIKITILDIQQPPFNNQKIQNIRDNMAKSGNLALSRISNRFIQD